MQLCEETGEEYTKWDGSTYCNPVEFPSTAPGRISPQPQKVQIRRDRLRTLNDFQRLFGDISHLRTITGVKNDELSNLFKTLEGDKDLNSPRELTPEAEKELALVEKKLQDGHVYRVDPKLDCILVILPSRHSPTGILMQREDVILEWIFLPNKQSKKLKTYVEKISDLILKGKLILRQLAGIDPAEIVVPLTKEEIEKLWAESEPWQRACSNFLGEINSKYPKSDRIELIKRADWILPQIVCETPISGVRTFYTDANKQGKAGYKSEDLSKVVQSPYNSVQKSKLYAILLVLMDFSEPLNIVTDSQYAERVVLHIETAKFIPDESELTSLFIQLQDIIRNRKHPLYITHIRSHTGLPAPLAQVSSFVYDYETCQLLAAPIYFREDMGIEEPADGVNFHSGERSISNLLGIMGIPKDGLQNLANTLEGDKDLNSPRELSAEAEKELAIVEKTIREVHVDRVNPELKCILVILPSRHSPTGILMQREDVILEWIFLPRKPNNKLKTYIEKISDLIHK
ncbi:hypothetical protein STEG23_036677, partial [Scotinomys teguina]